MTEEQCAAALETIGWSQRGLAAELACDERMVRRWALGEAPVPSSIARWLTRLAAFHARQRAAQEAFHASHPAPEDWRTRTPPGA